jgi:hypothetical protein
MKTLKLSIRQTDRSDVLCVVCGGFIANYVVVLADGSETDFGVHKSAKSACVARLRVKRSGSSASGESESWPGRPGPGGP